MSKVRIWDLPLRLFHWALVAAVAGAYLSERNNAMDWHERFGIAIVGLLGFRVVWGLLGSRHARFISFFPSPGRIRAYLSGRWNSDGHNPLGALSFIALLLVLTVQVVTGLLGNDDSSFNGPLSGLITKEWSDRLTGIHHQLEWVTLGLIGLHVAAVVFYLAFKRQDILTPMITGWKSKPVADPGRQKALDEKVTGTEPAHSGLVGLAVALVIAALVIFLASGEWIAAPPPVPSTPTPNF